MDIDLTWLPVQNFETDVVAISAALEHLAETFRARPLQLQVQISGGAKTGGITRLICSRGRARVQIETSQVMRGAVHPVRTMTVQPAVEQTFDFDTIFDAHFKGMTAEPVTAAQLLETRTRLLSWISDRLDEASCAFLWSVEDEDPDLGLIGLERAAALPGIGRKIQNPARRSKVKRRADRLQMAQMLTLREAPAGV